jgi:hypothetical protein
LEDNASTEYLLNFGLNGRTDHESFTACVPLAKDLESFIYRILDGDESFFFAVLSAILAVLALLRVGF